MLAVLGRSDQGAPSLNHRRTCTPEQCDQREAFASDFYSASLGRPLERSSVSHRFF